MNLTPHCSGVHSSRLQLQATSCTAGRTLTDYLVYQGAFYPPGPVRLTTRFPAGYEGTAQHINAPPREQIGPPLSTSQ